MDGALLKLYSDFCNANLYQEHESISNIQLSISSTKKTCGPSMLLRMPGTLSCSLRDHNIFTFHSETDIDLVIICLLRFDSFSLIAAI